jgi:hypothetical protein
MGIPFLYMEKKLDLDSQYHMSSWVRAQLYKLQKGYTRLAAASDKVYQLLSQGRWFSPGTPASSTTKTGRHSCNIAESGAMHQNSKKFNIICRRLSLCSVS